MPNEVANIRNQSKTTIQPYLVWCKGQCVDAFFLQSDGILIDLPRKVNPMAAFDLLYKMHFILNVEYAKSLSFFYNFMDCYVYQMADAVAQNSVKSLHISLMQYRIEDYEA